MGQAPGSTGRWVPALPKTCTSWGKTSQEAQGCPRDVSFLWVSPVPSVEARGRGAGPTGALWGRASPATLPGALRPPETCSRPRHAARGSTAAGPRSSPLHTGSSGVTGFPQDAAITAAARPPLPGDTAEGTACLRRSRPGGAAGP